MTKKQHLRFHNWQKKKALCGLEQVGFVIGFLLFEIIVIDKFNKAIWMVKIFAIFIQSFARLCVFYPKFCQILNFSPEF